MNTDQSAFIRVIRGQKLLLQIHLGSHLRELPNSRPRNSAVAVLASGQLVEDQLPEHLALASQHELSRKWLRSLKEIEAGIGDHADAFECHQRAHDVSEI